MAVEHIFIELGSFATNIYSIENGEKKNRSVMNPYDLITENGEIDILKFKSRVVGQIVGHCQSKNFPVSEVKLYATGIYRESDLHEVNKVLYENGIRDGRIIDQYHECELSFWSFYSNVERQQLYSNVKYIDIGGGSLEIGHFADGEMEKFYGFNFGVLHCLNILLLRKSGIQEAFGRLHHVLDQEVEKKSLVFEDEGYLSKCIITGSTVKNIDSKYIVNGIVTRDAYEEFIQAKKAKLFEKIRNTAHLKRLLQTYSDVRTSLRMILGGEFLLRIFDKMEITNFEINKNSLMEYVIDEATKKISPD